MAINVVNSLLMGEVGLNSFKVTKATQWSQQIRGAYYFLYPYIAQDFRGIKDCLKCHDWQDKTYSTDPPGRGGRHSGFIPPFMEKALREINEGMQPRAKRGGDNVGTYDI